MNRTIKIIATTAFAVAICVLLTSCLIHVGKNYRIDAGSGEIESIEIYFVSEPAPYIDTDAVPVTTVPAEKFDDFVLEFNKLNDFKREVLLAPGAVDPNFNYNGYVVRIKYASGAVEDINNRVQNKTGADGNKKTYHYSLDTESWNDFINSFLCSNNE